MSNFLFFKLLFKHFIKSKKINFYEKRKMISGEMYNPSTDINLFKERIRCKNLCHNFNSLNPKNLNERIKILKELIGKCPSVFFIEQPFICDYGYNIEIGENFYSNHNLVILDPAKVIFGNNVFIGPNCGFYTAEHPLDYQTRNKELEYAKPIIVGNNVWFGGSVTVIGGISIGDNVVIGAGSVVTKDIPSNTVVAGTPAKIIKNLEP